MSMHKSLKRKDHLARRRNVLTRSERIERLGEEEKWDSEHDSVFGLPKVTPEVVEAPVARRPVEEETAEGEAAETEGKEAGTEEAEG